MSIIDISIRRPIFITMVTVFLLVLGILALRKLPVDLYPEINYPIIVVRAELAGAAPEEMEQLITKKLEDALSTIAGITTMRSTSREAQAFVMLEFDPGIDVRFQEIQVRAKVANIRKALPEDMEEPIISRQDPDDAPIIEIAVTGDLPLSVISSFAEDEVAQTLRQIAGVGAVNLSGEREREIKVDLNPVKLDGLRLSAAAVVAGIRANNRNDPAGRLKGSARYWSLRSVSPISSVHDLERVPVSVDAAGQPVYLSDVATISDGFKERNSISHIGTAEGLRPAVLLDVLKQSGENTLKVSDKIRAQVDEISKRLPSGIEVLITRDNADLVRTNAKDVVESLLIGAGLTIMIVLVFLRSPRSTLTTGLALPSSVITTFAAMLAFGFTINVMTLLALSLAVGLLVDDAIVVRENIFRHLNAGILSPREAALKGTEEVVLAVLATTLTIVAMFLPVSFMGGVTGQFFKQFALTVVFAVLVSMWDAVSMAPLLSAHYANHRDPAKEWARWGRPGAAINAALLSFEHFFSRLAALYKAMLEWLLPRPWWAFGMTIMAAGLAVVGFTFVPKGFLPAQLGDSFSVTMSGPLAQPLEETQRVSEQVQMRLAKIKGLQFWAQRVGTNFNGSANIRSSVQIIPGYAKNQEQLAAVRQAVREAMSGFVGYTARVSEPSDPLAGNAARFSPIAVQVTGGDIKTLREVAGLVRLAMQKVPDLSDIAPPDDLGLPEVRVALNPDLASRFQITGSDLGATLKTWVLGDASNSLRLGDDQIPIRVRLAGGEAMPVRDLLANNIYVRGGSARDVPVPLMNVATWSTTAGPPVISRENRMRTLRVNAGLKAGAALMDVVKSLEAELAQIPLPAGAKVKVVGQNQQMGELFSNLIIALLLGGFFVYMVLASLFESFTQPITVLMAIPLAATGAVFALLVTGTQLDLYAAIGMILLAGIVAKNSILLIDFAMHKLASGEPDPKAAIIEAAPLRLRPILMTSAAMSLGMVPVALGLGAGGAARQSLGIATIGGVISSTLLSLVVVPNLFVAIAAFNAWWRRRRQRQKT